MTDILKRITDSESQEDSMKDRFLTFQIDDETLGIAIRQVREIIGIQPITAMPETPDYIRGVINLRGKIIPALDLRLRLGKPRIDYNDRTCIIVIDESTPVGLIVDSVSEVLTIPEEDIAEKPDIPAEGGGFVRSIGKVGEDVVLLLDCRKLLTGEGSPAQA